MSEKLYLYIHETSLARCLVKVAHRSGLELRPISVNDAVYGSNDLPCGVITSVEVERINKTDWLYRITYVPMENLSQPVGSMVYWTRPVDDVGIPDPIAERMQQVMPPQPVSQPVQQAATAVKPHKKNGRKRHKKQSVSNGQHGAPAQASAGAATATV